MYTFVPLTVKVKWFIFTTFFSDLNRLKNTVNLKKSNVMASLPLAYMAKGETSWK